MQHDDPEETVYKLCTNCEKGHVVTEQEVICPDCGTATLHEE